MATRLPGTDHSRYCIDGQAANALRPVAREAALLLFSVGIISCGMLAIPTFAGSAVYVYAEACVIAQGGWAST